LQVQQMSEHQSRGTRSDNADLRAHASLSMEMGSVQREV
jgi:hypothetical protein